MKTLKDPVIRARARRYLTHVLGQTFTHPPEVHADGEWISFDLFEIAELDDGTFLLSAAKLCELSTFTTLPAAIDAMLAAYAAQRCEDARMGYAVTES